MKYRKKPIVIEAIQHDNSYGIFQKIKTWSGNAESIVRAKLIDDKMCIQIDTLEGLMTANEGDWIIKGIKGELYPCKPDIFEATYEAVE